LRRARVKGHWLYHHGRKLTSEDLKFAIETACLGAAAFRSTPSPRAGDQGL